MRDVSVRRTAGAAFAVLAMSAVSVCGSSPITSARLERAIAPTFANLVQLQVSWLGLPPMGAAEFAVEASCRKLGANSQLGSYSGSGEWICALRWKGPQRQMLRDNYDLQVTPDGCYTAMVEGENLGRPTLKSVDGQDVKNLLYAFEGCFDTM
jgi:hypothetical protein